MIDGIEYTLDKTTKTAEVRYKTDGYSGVVNIPDKVTYQNMDFTVTSISSSAFSGSTELYVVTIPNTVTTLESNTFSGCSSLVYIDIPNSVTSIEYFVFGHCTSLRYIKLPEKITSLGLGLFDECESLKYVDIPDGVTFIGASCFRNCKSLQTINLPESLMTIDVCAFQNCTNLSSIVIPENVTRIWGGAFENCPNLKSVTLRNRTPISIDSSVFTSRYQAYLYVPVGCQADYEAADIWKDFIVKTNIQNAKTGDINYDGDRSIADVIKLVDIILNGDEIAYLKCPDGNHPHLIDLGLPSGTKWACCNVDASKPEAYGSYFAWGETQTKISYNWDNYTHCDGSKDNCHNIGSDIAATKYDVARKKWGGAWRMPSYDQIKELCDNCTSEWTTLNGVNGCRLTGPNGSSIFLPAAGYRIGDKLTNDGLFCLCWSSSSDQSILQNAYGIFSYDKGSFLNIEMRYIGRPVRPVSK